MEKDQPPPTTADKDSEDEVAEGMLPLASTIIPISKNGGASGMSGRGGDGGHGYSGGSGSGQQVPPPPIVEVKEILPVVPAEDSKPKAPQPSKARMVQDKILNAQPHDPNMVRLPNGS